MIEHFRVKNECAVCATPIWQYDGIKRKKTEQYNEASVMLNNESRMTVGVCNSHKQLKQFDLPLITEKARQGWLEEVALGIGKKEWVNNVGLKLEAVGVV